MHITQQPERMYYFTLGLMLFALLFALHIGLLPALLGGLLVYQFVEFGAKILHLRAGVLPGVGRLILLIFMTFIVVGGLTWGIFAGISFVTDGQDSLIALMQRMADVVVSIREHLPAWVQVYLPSNMNELQSSASAWLRENAAHLGDFGREVGGFLVHLVFGMIIGGLAALKHGAKHGHEATNEKGPLAAALTDRAIFLENAFSSVVFSQAKISALNTCLTGLFLEIGMPLLGMELPFTKTMIAVTFFAGLLPIIGNLISNTVIFLIALTVSTYAAIIAILYLIVIHKLEYLFNARIIGHQIRSRVWEILFAMLVMETTFGLVGIVAAPIYYAYLKEELKAKKLI